MKITKFIRKVLITEIGDIVDRHKYLSFGVVSQGIELLGACLDEHEFIYGKTGISRPRFDLALSELFPEKYRVFWEGAEPEMSLYKNIRCGMLHSVLPKNPFMLGQAKSDGRENHLKQRKATDGSIRYMVIAEEYYEDFRCACYQMIEMIEDKSILESEKIRECEANSKDNIEKRKKIEILRLEREFLRTDL